MQCMKGANETKVTVVFFGKIDQIDQGQEKTTMNAVSLVFHS